MKALSYATKGVRYASSTTGVNFEKILTWAAIAGGLYIALEILGFFKKVSDAGNDLSEAAANAYVAATNPPVVEVLASAVLPNGQTIPMSTVARLDFNGNDGSFSVAGVRYKLSQRRADNNYDAVRA